MSARRAILVASACNARTACVRSPWNVPVRPAGAGDSEAWVSGVRFALLGTLMLADGGGDPVAVAGARQRALLASLLLSANAPVSCDALAEAVWDGSPPPGAAATLRSHVRPAAPGPGAPGGFHFPALAHQGTSVCSS